MLPTDAFIADAFKANAQQKVVPANEVPIGWRILDIGPETVKTFSNTVKEAKTIIWNGPMGVFEMEPFSKGTFAIAQAMAAAAAKGAMTIIGGGDSVSAVEQSGLADKMGHISTGGGALLELLEGQEQPGVAALNDK